MMEQSFWLPSARSCCSFRQKSRVCRLFVDTVKPSFKYMLLGLHLLWNGENYPPSPPPMKCQEMIRKAALEGFLMACCLESRTSVALLPVYNDNACLSSPERREHIGKLRDGECSPRYRREPAEYLPSVVRITIHVFLASGLGGGGGGCAIRPRRIPDTKLLLGRLGQLPENKMRMYVDDRVSRHRGQQVHDHVDRRTHRCVQRRRHFMMRYYGDCSSFPPVIMVRKELGKEKVLKELGGKALKTP